MLAYKFRLYPNQEEERKLLWTKEVCRRVYNRFLELYNAGEHDRFKLQALLPVWKKDNVILIGGTPKCSSTSCIVCSLTYQHFES